MSDKPKIVCVVPSIRPEQMAKFRVAWAPRFERHGVTLVTVWDGDNPEVVIPGEGTFTIEQLPVNWSVDANRNLFCRHTDAVRNIGFVAAAKLGADFVLTLDDDCLPFCEIENKYHPDYPNSTMRWSDPIQSHLDALTLRVPLSWMNTAHQGAEYLRGVPYGVRDEAPVMLSHGVWVGTPDLDGQSQLRLERTTGVPNTLPYYVGPIPRGVLFPLSGMSVMVRREALPYFYFAPMGPDSGHSDLHRFADIFMGVYLKREFDRLGWACYTGASTVLHTRASDAVTNFEREKLGREWIETFTGSSSGFKGDLTHSQIDPHEYQSYFRSYADKRERYAALIRSIQSEK